MAYDLKNKTTECVFIKQCFWIFNTSNILLFMKEENKYF